MATEVFDWEVVNDDGFVYKRRKSQQLQISSSTTSASASASASAAPVRPNPAVAELKRKKRVLLRISKKFDKDIEELEAWEKTLNDLKVKSKIEQQKSSDPQPQPQTQPQPQLQSSSGFSSVDQRLSQAEAQEDVICNVLKRCDVAEALCTAAEERVNQPFFDLPIWAHSPRSLIKSLGEE